MNQQRPDPTREDWVEDLRGAWRALRANVSHQYAQRLVLRAVGDVLTPRVVCERLGIDRATWVGTIGHEAGAARRREGPQLTRKQVRELLDMGRYVLARGGQRGRRGDCGPTAAGGVPQGGGRMGDLTAGPWFRRGSAWVRWRRELVASVSADGVWYVWGAPLGLAPALASGREENVTAAKAAADAALVGAGYTLEDDDA